MLTRVSAAIINVAPCSVQLALGEQAMVVDSFALDVSVGAVSVTSTGAALTGSSTVERR